jgi:hypothetical protein
MNTDETLDSGRLHAQSSAKPQETRRTAANFNRFLEKRAICGGKALDQFKTAATIGPSIIRL